MHLVLGELEGHKKLVIKTKRRSRPKYRPTAPKHPPTPSIDHTKATKMRTKVTTDTKTSRNLNTIFLLKKTYPEFRMEQK